MMNIKTRLQGIAQRFSYAARHLFARTGRQVNAAGLALDILTQREQRNELPWLTPQRAVELYEAWRRGELADVQRVWEQLEETDDTLMTVLDKRQRALEDMPWAILTDAEAIGDDAERARKAELQQAYLRTVFNAVENLEEALVHLGMADFRGVAALEITGNMQRMRWEVIEPWCLARPVRRGPWMYNAKADVTFSTLEEMEKERIIVREARPIDLSCMFLIVDKMHAIHGWDAFLDVFGNPSIFLELPQATNEQMAKVYDALAKRIIGDGRGTVPSGSKFQTVETRQNNCDSFEKRAKWCADAIITVATGGLLTVKAESGSGTLAGSAHTDSFENLVAGSAASISATINKQFTRRLLAEAFPNDPPLAYFSLAPEPADERMRLAQLLATLKTAGWQPTQEKVAELMQMEVEPVPAAPTTAPDESAQPHTQPLVNRSSGLQPAEDTDTAEPPLNEGELEALRFLGAGLNPEQVAEDAEFMAEAMRESTIDELRSTKSDNAALRADGEEAVVNSCNQHGHEEDCANPSTGSVGKDKEVDDKTHAENSHPKKISERSTPESVVPQEEARPIVGDYKENRMKEAQKHAKSVLPREVNTPLKDAPRVAMNGSDIKEMLNTKAVYSSVRNGVSPKVHEEAVLSTPVLLPKSKEVSRRSGGKKDKMVVIDGKKIVKEDPIAEIIELDAAFKAKDGQGYTARYSVQKYKKPNMQPKVYFMYCRK